MSIPTKYLRKMGDYEIIVDDIPLTAKVLDNREVMEELIPSYLGVPACELAARVFKKPGLFNETRFEIIANEVNVSYKSPGSKPVEE
ncbi:3-phosphoshikimate 1-carboxyvinyltransferase [Bienertia sinuspersici]